MKSLRLLELNNLCNLISTPRTFIGVLIMTRLVGKDATSNMRLPHVGQAGRIKIFGGLPVIVAMLSPNKQQTTNNKNMAP